MTDSSPPSRVSPAELAAARAEHRRSLEEWRRGRDEMRWAAAQVAKHRAAALAALGEREARILAAIRGGKTLSELVVEFHASRRYLVRLRALVKSQDGAVPRDPGPRSPSRSGDRSSLPSRM